MANNSDLQFFKDMVYRGENIDYSQVGGVKFVPVEEVMKEIAPPIEEPLIEPSTAYIGIGEQEFDYSQLEPDYKPVQNFDVVNNVPIYRDVNKQEDSTFIDVGKYLQLEETVPVNVQVEDTIPLNVKVPPTDKPIVQEENERIYEGKLIDTYSVCETAELSPMQNFVYEYPEVIEGLKGVLTMKGKNYNVLIRRPITFDTASELADRNYIAWIYTTYKHISVDDANWDSEFWQQVHYSPYTRIVIVDNIPIGIFTLDMVKPDHFAYIDCLIPNVLPNGRYTTLGLRLFKNSELFDMIIESIKNMDSMMQPTKKLNIRCLNLKIPSYLENNTHNPKVNIYDGLSLRQNALRRENKDITSQQMNEILLSSILKKLTELGFEKRGNLKDEERKNGKFIAVSTYQLRLHYYKSSKSKGNHRHEKEIK